MDPEKTILHVLRNVVGCNGARDFGDLGKMRQDTLEKRLDSAKKYLTRANMMSIYAMWLRDKISRIGGEERSKVVKDLSWFCDSWDCSLARVIEVWEDCTKSTLKARSVPDQNRVLRQMDAVRQDIMRLFPTRSLSTEISPTKATQEPKKSNTPNAAAQQPSKVRGTQAPRPEAKPNTSTYPPSKRRKSNDAASTNFQPPRERWTDTVDERYRSSGPGPNYICNRCGQGGHFIYDCPTNQDPEYDPVPKPSYLCRLCGIPGDHYITSCPKADNLTRPTDRYRSSGRLPSSEMDFMDPFDSTRTWEGRLSPWETDRDQYIADVQGHVKFDESNALRTAEGFLKDFETQLNLDGQLEDLSLTLERSELPPRVSPDSPEEPPVKKLKVERGAQSTTGIYSFYDYMDEDVDMGSLSDPCDSDDMYEPPFESVERYEPGKTYDSDDQYEPKEPAEPIEPYVTQKVLYGQNHGRSYDSTVIRLHQSRGNTWVNVSSRPTALELWERKEY